MTCEGGAMGDAGTPVGDPDIPDTPSASSVGDAEHRAPMAAYEFGDAASSA